MATKLLADELDKLVVYLDESTELFCKRLDFRQFGEKGKAKFIDERLLPIVDQKIRKQTEVVSKLLEGTV